MTPADQTPGQRLDQLLDEIHWSRRTCASILGRTETTVRRWAADETPTPQRVMDWLEALAAFHRQHPAPEGHLEHAG